LTSEKKHSKLIEAAEEALKKALELVKKQKSQTKFNEIGKIIEEEIKKRNFSPIVNLSGHSLDEFDIHSGITIPNVDNGNAKTLGEGAFAIEPFATLPSGSGSVYDGNGSNIYHITGSGAVRDSFAREVLSWVLEVKKTLPFSQRELEKKFGSKAIVAVSNLKRAGAIKEFPQLIEKSHAPVSQAETSLIIHQGVVEILVD
jgi:methionyl aminopeptidase